jgi:hypothetical protein
MFPYIVVIVEFDSTGVKLYIFIHNEVRDFDKNSTQPEIRVNQVRDNESKLYFDHLQSNYNHFTLYLIIYKVITITLHYI